MNNTIKLDFPGKKIIAHRGVSGLEKENTIAAFIAAGNRTQTGIECDIHRTADGRYVVIHDAETKRVSDDEINVERVSLRLVRSVLLKDTDGECRKDLFIPTFEEYLKICRKYGKTAVVELKGVYEKDWLEDVIQQTKLFGDIGNTIFIAFDLIDLIRLREILPDQPAQYLTCQWSEELIDTLKTNKLDLDILYTQLTRERIAALHSHGIKVNCWTVDDAQEAIRLLEDGVDYITSNILE